MLSLINRRRAATLHRYGLLAGCAALLQAGCTRGPEGGAVPGGQQAGALRQVGYVLPTRGDVARTIAQPATIQGIEEASLYAKTSGYLKQVLVDKGDRVRRGQLLAVIESPEIHAQQLQAGAAYRQSLAATQGTIAAKGRAQADVAQAAAAVERAKADTRQAEAAIGKAQADQARSEAQVPKMKALAAEAAAAVQQAEEQQGQSQAEVRRWQQQAKSAQAALRAAQAGEKKAAADFQLQQVTYNRYKSVQDRDAGLITGQQVDEARARMEASRNELEAAGNRVEAAREEVGTAEQQVESARRQAAAAAKRVDAARGHADAAREDLQIAQKEIDAARQQVRVTEAQRDSAQRQVAVAENQRKALGTQVMVAEAGIAAARQESQGSKEALSAAASMAGYARLVAPFDGLVTERFVDPGAFVQNAANNQAAAKPVLKVVRDQSLRVLVPVPESAIPSIRRGQPAAIAVDAYPKYLFQGTVTRFASALDSKTRTMVTEVDIPNRHGQLRPGMYARVTLTLGIHRDALSVPSEAVMGPEDKRFVYVVVNGHARRTPVTVGVDDGKSAEITSGLDAESQVVVVGRDTLVDGAAVKAQPAPPATK